MNKCSHITNTTYRVPEWLSSFAYADFIVTDSFHGMVYSIIFKKNFLVIGNHSRGLDRFTSLLSLLNLEDRLVLRGEDIQDKKIKEIDYKMVNKILEENKKKSLDYLINSLDNNSNLTFAPKTKHFQSELGKQTN